MGDVICAQCGEPWEYYGIYHGDMEKDEIKPFLEGKNCPCCADDPPKKKDRFLNEHFSSLMDSSDEDIIEYLPI